jgi:hypothetical protein
MVSKATPEAIIPGDIRRVGKSGQISLGKRLAGKTFCVEQRLDGSFLLTAVAMIPESQLWTLREPDRGAIARGMTWAAANPPAETDLDQLLAEARRRRPRRSRAGSK